MSNTTIFSLLNDTTAALKAVDLTRLDAVNLVPLIKAVQDVCAAQAAIHAEIERRALGNNEMLPGVVVKPSVTHRKWHDAAAAEQLAQEAFGDAAFTRTLKSPAQIEKMDGGDTFVAVASFKPDAGRKVVY